MERRSLPQLVILCLISALGCGSMVHVATDVDRSEGPKPEDPVAVDLYLRTDAMGLSITNRTDTPITVLWDKALIVDTDGNTFGVVHRQTPPNFAISDVAGSGTRLAPYATLDDFIVPARCVTFAPASGWDVVPLLLVECGPVKCIGYHELVGKTVHLRLAFDVNGSERDFAWTLRITRTVKSVRGARPSDPELH
jgi:hypothetical protein